MLNIWEQRLKEGLGLFPIIPMIVYHGKGNWKVKGLRVYFEGEMDEELNRFIPYFDYLLTNLQQESHDSIRSRFQLLTLQMGFLLMKSSRDELLLEKIVEIFQGIESLLEDEQGKIFFEQIIVYLLKSTKIEQHKIMDKIRGISYEVSEFADNLWDLRFNKGKEEGVQETLKLAISKLLLNGMKVDFIAQVLEVPVKQVKEIQEKLKKEGKLK